MTSGGLSLYLESIMDIIRSWEEMASYLDDIVDHTLAQLLTTRRQQLHGYGELSELGSFAIVQSGDTLAAIEAALELSIATNFVDGKRFGDPDFMPSWESIERYSGWFALTYILTDDGFGHVVIVPDAEGIDPILLELCRAYVDQPNGDSAIRAESN